MAPVRSALAFSLILMLSSITLCAEIASPKKAFSKLCSLVGNWEAKTERGTSIRINYRLISGESVLVQTYTTASGRETLTVFHMDGAFLMATHYCAQGNQPRLRLVNSTEERALTFLFFDATDLPDSNASHLHRMIIDFLDLDHFLDIETYSSNGKDETEILKFARVK